MKTKKINVSIYNAKLSFHDIMYESILEIKLNTDNKININDFKGSAFRRLPSRMRH